MSNIKNWIEDRREEAEDLGLCDQDADEYVQNCWDQRIDAYLEASKYENFDPDIVPIIVLKSSD